MTEGNPGNGSAAPESTLPVKRRRGRPRKDESLSHGENSSSFPASDGTKKNRHDKSDSTGSDDSAFVGQMVSGILDGSFDAGYLLTVKVGNTDTVMRGLVFDPRLSVPISAENDVAPHVKMFKRSEIPLPIPAQPLSQAPPIVGQKELSYELPTNLHECNVTVLQPQESVRGMQRETNHAFPQASQPSSSQSKDKTKTAAVLPKGLPDADQAARTAPLAQTSKTGRRKSDHITKNGVILLPYYPVPSVVAQASQSEVKDQPKTEDFTAASTRNITPIQSGLPNGAAVPEVTKLKAETEPSAEIRQGNEDGKELHSVTEQPPGVQTHFFTPPIPDTVLKVGPSAELDSTLPPPAEQFQSVSQSLEMLLEKNVSPLGHFASAGMQDLMQPKAKILEKGGHLSASSTGAVEVPITDLHFDFISNHPMGPYGATEHEIPNPTPPAFAPKDTI